MTLLNLLRKLFGIGPHWFRMQCRNRVDIIWSDDRTFWPYSPHAGVKGLLSPNGKEKLRLHWWTRALLPSKPPYKPTVPRFIDSDAADKVSEQVDRVEYEQAVPPFM